MILRFCFVGGVVRLLLLVGDVEVVGMLILFVYGLVDNCSIFILLCWGLLCCGFGCVYSINYLLFIIDVWGVVWDLVWYVEVFVVDIGYE